MLGQCLLWACGGPESRYNTIITAFDRYLSERSSGDLNGQHYVMQGRSWIRVLHIRNFPAQFLYTNVHSGSPDFSLAYNIIIEMLFSVYQLLEN
jgi:hypothetical protein